MLLVAGGGHVGQEAVGRGEVVDGGGGGAATALTHATPTRPVLLLLLLVLQTGAVPALALRPQTSSSQVAAVAAPGARGHVAVIR